MGSKTHAASPRAMTLSVHGSAATPAANARIVTASSGRPETASRSEEHTSGLQSPMRIPYAVFCLKKKKPKRDRTKQHTRGEKLGNLDHRHHTSAQRPRSRQYRATTTQRNKLTG